MHYQVIILYGPCYNVTVVAKNVGHVGHCRRQDPNVRWVLCKHQTICPTAQAKTWLLKCLQSRKNCQCTSSILLNEICYFPLWVTGVLYEKIDPNHVLIDWRKWGYWQSWSQTLLLHCSNQFPLGPLFVIRVNKILTLSLLTKCGNK